MLWVLIRIAWSKHMFFRRGDSNEYPQLCFYGELEKILLSLSPNTSLYVLLEGNYFSTNRGEMNDTTVISNASALDVFVIS